MCCRDKRDLTVPARTPDQNMNKLLKFYNTSLHSASFTLPSFARDKIYQTKQDILP